MKILVAIIVLLFLLAAAGIRVMQQSIALNASFFNTHRMVRQYLLHSYGLGDET